MTKSINSIKRISQTPRKDPLTDLKALTSVAKSATAHARARAWAHKASITVAKNGYIVKITPDGKETKIKPLAATAHFPSLSDDLCQG